MWKRYGMACLMMVLCGTPLLGVAQMPIKDAEGTSKALHANHAYVRGMMAWTQMDYPKALHYLGEAVRLQPQNVTYREALAMVKQQPGRTP